MTSLWRFVCSIGTVLFTVAYPSLMDASNTIVAIELLLAVAHLLSVLNILKEFHNVRTRVQCDITYCIFLSRVPLFLTIARIFSSIRYFDDDEYEDEVPCILFRRIDRGNRSRRRISIATLCNNSRNMQNQCQVDTLSDRNLSHRCYLRNRCRCRRPIVVGCSVCLHR